MNLKVARPRPCPRARGVRVAFALVLTLAAAGCGSSSSNSSSSSQSSAGGGGSAASSSTAVSHTVAAYDGPEANLPTTYPTPTVKPGTKFSVAYLCPNAGVASLQAQSHAIEAETKKLGGSFVEFNTLAGPQAQATDFQDALTKGVNAIVVQPEEAASLAPLVKQAAAKHVAVIAASTPTAANQPNLPGYATDPIQGVDLQAYQIAAELAKADPGASFAALGTSLPFASTQYLTAREIYWGKKLGLKYLGRVNMAGATPAQASAAEQAILARYPTTQAVLAWYDVAAEAAVSANRASQKSNIKVYGYGGDAAAIDLVRSGQLAGDSLTQESTFGTQEAIAAYDEVTKQHLPLPAKVLVAPLAVTKANAASVKGW